MTDRELMQMALDALDYVGYVYTTEEENQEVEQAIEALRTALAQPEKTDMQIGITYEEANPHVHAVNISQERVHKTEKNEHEPVAWVVEGFGKEKHCIDYEQNEIDAMPVGTKFYTVPPQPKEPVIDKTMATRIATQLGWVPKKEWRGLTYADLYFWGGELGLGELGKGVLRAVDAHLREKNT